MQAENKNLTQYDHRFIKATSKTLDSIPYFEEDLFCEQLIEDILICNRRGLMDLLAYKVCSDQFIMICRPIGQFSHSKIMQNIKRTSSQHINQILGYNEIYDGNVWINNSKFLQHIGEYIFTSPASPIQLPTIDIVGKLLSDQPPVSDDPESVILAESANSVLLRKLRLNTKYGQQFPCNHFKWQKSFRQDIIRNKFDLGKQLNLISKVWIKSGQKYNTYFFVNHQLLDTILS